MAQTSSRYADFVKQPNRASLHVPVDGRWVSRYQRQPDAQSPAGGVSSTALDMARWMTMELAGGWYAGKQVAPSLALAKAHAPQIRSSAPGDPAALPRFYGYGTNYQVAPSGRVHLGHSGAFSAGAGTTYLLIPELDLGIVALTNGFAGLPEAMTQSFADLVEFGEVTEDWMAIVQQVFGGVYAPDTSRPPANARAPRPDRAYTGTYANDFWGDVTVRRDSRGLHAVLGPDRVRLPLAAWDGDTFKATLANGDIPTTFLVTFTGSPRATTLDMQFGDSQDGLLTRIGR
jgi:CubicO group peptidase (beta-lactamase class C family)